MKKHLLITAVLVLGVVLAGCGLLSSGNQENTIGDNGNGQAEKQNDEVKAEETLISFFNYLNDQDYENALVFFESDFTADSWAGLEVFSLPEDRDDKARVMKNYCEATGTCLEAKVLETKEATDDIYDLVVQFEKADGDVFVLGPCCGATEEEMPSRDKFDFKVKKIGESFKVITPPVYVP